MAIDGSEFANKGLEEAIKIAKKFNSKIYLIYVGEPIDFEFAKDTFNLLFIELKAKSRLFEKKFIKFSNS